MYEKFAALAFALIATVSAQDEMYGDDLSSYSYEQTPQPLWDEDLVQWLAIPEDFGEFDNNVDSVGLSLWYDGDDSDIFLWAVDNYDINTDFGVPTGDVFLAAVNYIREVSSIETQYLCFDDSISTVCAGTQGDLYTTFAIDSADLPEEDGEVDTTDLAYEELTNTDDFGTYGAGIGYEFGQAYDSVEYVWAVWSWADGSDKDVVEGTYDVYVIQGDDAGAEYIFSDTIDLVYNGASKMAGAAIASATVLYALI